MRDECRHMICANATIVTPESLKKKYLTCATGPQITV